MHLCGGPTKPDKIIPERYIEDIWIGGMAGTICLRIFLLLLTAGIILICTVAGDDDIIQTAFDDPEIDMPDQVLIGTVTDSLEIGDIIHLNGTIDADLMSGSPSDVVILIAAPQGSHADTFVLASPDRSGSFAYSLRADVAGTWEFEALYTGIYSPKILVDVVPSAEPGKTILTLSGWPTYPRIGDDVTFKGRLSDAKGGGIADRKVTYEFATSAFGCVAGCRGSGLSGWQPAGTERTDHTGAYSFTLPVVEEGGVTVRVIFEGDDQYTGTESPEVGITATGS